MKDYLVKALAYDGQVRVYAATTIETVGEAQSWHYIWGRLPQLSWPLHDSSGNVKFYAQRRRKANDKN